MSQTSEYRRRIATVKQWLTAAGWKPTEIAFDYPAVADRAVSEWYHGRGSAGRQRAEVLVAKAARLLRGEQVKVTGGRPRKWIKIPVEQNDR